MWLGDEDGVSSGFEITRKGQRITQETSLASMQSMMSREGTDLGRDNGGIWLGPHPSSYWLYSLILSGEVG